MMNKTHWFENFFMKEYLNLIKMVKMKIIEFFRRYIEKKEKIKKK